MHKFVSVGEPDVTLFSPQEIDVVNTVFDGITLEHTPSSISELSHDEIWKAAQIGEEIPFYATLLSHLEPIDEEDIRWAKSA